MGFNDEPQVREALAAMEGYVPRSEAELAAAKAGAGASFEGICTGCGYCDDCPQGIPIPKFMDAYNQKLLGDQPGKDVILNRLTMQWGLKAGQAGDCAACGQCETACTQHINIIARLKAISSHYDGGGVVVF
ncbi:MAG: 4Fe-4S dicluster domain-containing protein [Treponema sp.]|nr:4Fe-4S dicluster domain-containing protein [Treponema sp.]